MSELDAGEEFWDSLYAAQNNVDPDTSNAWLHADDEIDDESTFDPTSFDENDEIDDIVDLFQPSRTTEGSDDESTRGAAFDTGESESAADSPAINAPTEMPNTRQSAISEPPTPHTTPIPRLRSIAHHDIINEKAWFLSLDVETAGEVAGNLDGTPNTNVGICDELAQQAGLTNVKGRVLYTDNYYTSMALVRHFMDNYGWSIVGTFNASEKKSRADLDFPFLKLSRGARDSVKLGWFREAVIELRTPTGKTYYVQATTWKDKKQVCFLSSSSIGFSDGLTVKRHTRKRAKRDTIPAPRAQAEYVKYFNAVDRNDRDSSDYSTTIRTNRYYLRVFTWSLDRIIHCAYVIACSLAKNNIGPKSWRGKYDNKNGGRRKFQIDLGIALLNYGIGLEWDGKEDSVRPRWMRQKELVPCDCKMCFFCLRGLTGGIDHKRKDNVIVEYSCGSRLKTKKCTTERVQLMDKDGMPMTSGRYCRMCYRKQPSDWSSSRKKSSCKTSTWGCAQCNEPICSECWKVGYDRHKSGNTID